VKPKLDASFLSAIRALRTFTHECDLDGLAGSAADPLALLVRLVEQGLLRKDDAGILWSRLIGVAYVDPFGLAISEKAVDKLPAEIAKKAQALPLYLVGDALTIAMADPTDKKLIQRLSGIVGLAISPVFSFPADVHDLVQLHYSSEESLADALRQAEGVELFAAGADLSSRSREIAQLAENDQVIRFINALILFAVRREASDIHIEAWANESIVRYRIDGNLHDVLRFSRKLHGAVVTRLKIMAMIDIVERRFPTDGRFSMPLGSTSIDFRFSSIPSQYGEKVVVRVLGSMSRRSLLSLDRMLISRSILQPFRRVLRNPSGIIFVIGPTGSGKTTTLYAALAELNDRKVNISTIEDPIELKLEGITQTQVQPGIDMSFARMLRALLRQDPDIMLVGEIRDLETAKIATEAALTGHLVLATMHTNSAPEALVRLSEMGVDPFMVAPTVTAVLSQRLAPRICENCKEPYRPSDDVLRRYFNDEEFPEVTFYRGRGCPLCNRTGFKGRIAFHELLLVNRRVRTLISKRASQMELAEAAARIGYRPLRYDGLVKVLLGLTTIEEIEAQTPVEIAEAGES
jgi:type II secretory ATPase GspE/PulE/Tfp pilus assembly ATPase PilB-like protein